MVISECVQITCYACVVLVYLIIYDQRPILHVHWKFLISECMVLLSQSVVLKRLKVLEFYIV